MESAKSYSLPEHPGVAQIVWFEMPRVNHRTLRQLPPCRFRFHEVDPSLSILRFCVSRDDHRRKTVWYQAQYPLVSLLCCHTPLQHIWLAFLRTIFAGKNKQVQNHHRVLDFTSHPGLGSCPVTLGRQDGSILSYFDKPWNNEDLTKSKTFCGKSLQI